MCQAHTKSLNGDSRLPMSVGGSDLSGLSLAERDLLRMADFTGSVFHQARLVRARLDSARFVTADLSYTNLNQASLVGADLRGAIFKSARLIGADLTSVNLEPDTSSGSGGRGGRRVVDLEAADLSFAQLLKSRIKDAHALGANFSGAVMFGARMTGTNLTGSDFSGALMRDADLSGSNLANANVTGAVMVGVNLDDAQTGDVNMRLALTSN